jgi:GH24 family phage-related lysozyme (muramidase)
MNQETVLNRLLGFEGCVPYMYRCSGGAVTAGVGHVLPTAGDATALPWELSGRPASAAEIAADFGKVSASPIGLPAVSYEPLTGCRLPQVYLVDLADADITRFEGYLQKEFPQWSSFPEPAQEGLFDMAFNLGIGGLQKFPRFLAAVQAGDWGSAANECHRLGISEERNQEIAGLFRQAIKN